MNVIYQNDTFSTFLECTPDAAVIINSRGNIELVNEQTEKMFHYTKKELIGKPVEILIPDRYVESHINYRNQFLSHPKTRPMGHPGVKLTGKRKNGEEFIVEISLSPIRTSQEELLVFAAIRDISNRIKIEEDLERTKNIFKRIFEYSIYGILNLEAVLDTNGEVVDFKYILVNQQAAEYLNLDREKVIGKTVTEVNPDYKKSERFEILTRVFKTGNTETHELCVEVGGKSIWLRGTWIKLDTAVFVTFDNINERKQAQTELQELNKELEKRVNERTKELTATNERLKSINQKLDRYAYMITHDLKVPLANIEGIASVLEEEYMYKSLDEEGIGMLAMMKKTINDMREIIENVLNSAKDEIKNKEPISLYRIAQEVIETLNPPSHYHIFIQSNLPNIMYQRTSIIQIFQNLISNAIKYMDKEQPLITISCNEMEDQYLICVTDNGPGIPEEKQKEIFQMFSVAHDGRQDVESHGIGLAIVKQLVEENGGKIWVESQLGRETKLHFTVPKT